ncbi:MAG: hypothetical protein E7359_00635 [Clostridiales bacterium]|nr:hypothetical protein [Clostridiales bacterium]
MINLTDLLSKPVISIMGGKTEGIIKNAIFDKNFKRLKYLILFDNNEHQEEKALFINNIYSFGENALIVKNGQDLNLEISCVKIEDKKLPINNSIYTYLGKHIGTVTDIILDEKYYIKSLVANEKIINIEEIISCGEDAVIIQDENKKLNLTKLKRIKSKHVKIFDNKKDFSQKVVVLEQEEDNENLIEKNRTNNLVDELIQDTNKEIVTEEKTQKLETTNKIKYEITENPSTPKTMIINTDFLIGRKLEKNIYSQNKELIARKNTKITQDILNKAKMFYKLRELTKYSR